ncbi:MAG TPA: hypothetical protein VJS11_13355 [Acidobacteriaceae bacterium]|nr:hypothetical protein [Acidobacteriaceae bacterium]
MKPFLSALLLIVVPAAFAQSQPQQGPFEPGVVVSNSSPATVEAMKAQAEYMNHLMRQTECPLFLSAASVAAPAGYLPVAQRRPDDGTLTLHFRNQSGKEIRSASVTAKVKVKTNIYDLDAHPVALQLTFSGTDDVNRELDQLSRIELPRHYYVFGLAEVSLDSVTYADGTSWTNPKPNKYCSTTAQGIKQVEAK